MADSGVVEENDLDWEHVFDNVPVVLTDLFEDNIHPLVSDSSAETSVEGFANPSPDSVSLWIGEVEHLLMKDDDNGDEALVEPNPEFCRDFLSDILLDSPADPSADIADVSDDNNWSASQDDGRGREKIHVSDVNDNNNNGEDEDPISKKRRRQLRNRDAALRSRERKKMHVRDLEMKSRYLEGECRRLGRLLQCCIAENHALRFQLQNDKASGASMTKQESAVLLLESLLLGSLLWSLGIICLFTLPGLPQSTLEAVSQENGDSRLLESVAQRGAGSKITGLRALKSLFRSKRCKASWTKMKSIILAVWVLV